MNIKREETKNYLMISILNIKYVVAKYLNNNSGISYWKYKSCLSAWKEYIDMFGTEELSKVTASKLRYE